MISDRVGTLTLAILLVTDIAVFAKVVSISLVKATVMTMMINNEIIPPVIVLYSYCFSNLSILELLKKSLAVSSFLKAFKTCISSKKL